MNQIFLGSFALILTFSLWAFGRKPLLYLKKSKQSNFKINKSAEKISLVKLENRTSEKQSANSSAFVEQFWEPPKSAQQKVKLKEKLRISMKGGPEERLKAIRISRLLVSADIVLPILRRGLNDSDSQVVKEAAAALEKYRGLPKSPNFQEAEMLRPPRNVALMR